MRGPRSTAAGTGLLLCAALSACGGSGGSQAPPADPDQAAAVASVQRLADAVEARDAAAGCRALTLATRRVVGLTGEPGAACSTALEDFLVLHGLRRTLPEARRLTARVEGTRATVRGDGLKGALTATRDDAGWRVSLVGLPGVRADVTAARACGRYLTTADALGLPPVDPVPLAARLRSEAGLVDRLRRRLAALPAAGPARLGLPEVLATLTSVRDGLRRQARRVDRGGSVPRAIQAGARADVLVRELLGEEAARARVACPLDATKGPELAARRTILDAACTEFGVTVDRLDANPATPEETRRLLGEIDDALGSFDARLRRIPVAPRLKRLRTRSRGAVRALRAQVAAVLTAPDAAAIDEVGRLVDGYSAQVDAALIRLGATCLDPSPGAAPSPRPSPGPPGGTPAPGPFPREAPGTVLS